MENEIKRVFFVLEEELDVINDRMVDTAIKVPEDMKEGLERAGKLITTADKELGGAETKAAHNEVIRDVSNEVLIKAARRDTTDAKNENKRIDLLNAITRKNPEKYENQTYSEWRNTIDEAIKRWPTRWELTIEGARPVEPLRIVEGDVKATLKDSNAKVKTS